MDGNGRWAQKRHRPRFFGHIKGARVARDIISACARLKIDYLTLYAFSTENWRRPETEVHFLMRLLERHLSKERQQLIDENIRFHVISDTSRLPESARHELKKTLEATASNTGMHLTFALNYGGRQEIVSAARRLAEMAKNNEIKPEQIDEVSFSKALNCSYLPDPDLIIRTSGESRLSNFLTWQSSYSEFYVTEVLWPDFKEADLKLAINNYLARERRFGAVVSSEQLFEL
jgi:undecaprenyl diphosphate synthase